MLEDFSLSAKTPAKYDADSRLIEVIAAEFKRESDQKLELKRRFFFALMTLLLVLVVVIILSLRIRLLSKMIK